MTGAAELVAQADALLESVDPASAHPDLAALLASYRAVQGNPAAWITARAVVRCAERVGVEAGPAGGGYEGRKVADLKAEVEARNEGREEADLIVPEGTKKADLIAALEADDAKA